MGTLRKKYTVQFKEEAINLAKKVGMAKAAQDLGVNPSNIRRWQNGHQNENSNVHEPSNLEVVTKENRRLKKENRYLLEVNEILKKSLGIFVKDKNLLP